MCFKNADFTAEDMRLNSERKLRHSFLGFCLVVSADNVAVKLIVSVVEYNYFKNTLEI